MLQLKNSSAENSWQTAENESPVPQLLETKADLDEDHIQWLIQSKMKNKASYENKFYQLSTAWRLQKHLSLYYTFSCCCLQG